MDDVARDEIPGALAEAFLERERGIRSLLDDLDALAARGEHATVRERVRDVAAEDEEAFFAVAFALSGSPEFYGDVEAQLGVEPADALRDLGGTYPGLSSHFGLVRLEVAADRRNPITDIDVTTAYLREERVPVVAYTLSSGELDLLESRGSPQEVLRTAGFLVGATNDALEAALAGDHPVNTDELSELIDRREELEGELASLRDRIDELRRTPADEE